MKQKYKEALMDMACRFGQTSEAERLKVGCLIYKNDAIISVGCNGQPPGWSYEYCEDTDGNTLSSVRHAEIAALEKLWQSSETAQGSSMFISHSPCKNCAIKIATAGIIKVYYRTKYRTEDGIRFLLAKNIKVEQVP